jgi:hypothetical protein
LLLTFLPTVLGFMQNVFNFQALTVNQWLICAGLALVLVLTDEVIKFFLRRRHVAPAAVPAEAAAKA